MRFDADHGVRFDAIGWQMFVYEGVLFVEMHQSAFLL